MNKYFKKFIFLALFITSPLFIQTIVAAPPPPDPKDVPIDGGLGILLAAGVAYAAKRLYNNRDQEI